MIHYVAFPSALPERGFACARAWQSKGYLPFIYVDKKDWPRYVSAPWAVMTKDGEFPGYYAVVNEIARRVFKAGAVICTFIGDDMLPPEHGANEHSRRYFARFPDGYGVMQCTGDRQGEVIGGKVNSERICGSPTFGRDWHEKAFAGSGGFPTGFKSFYADELLKEVAEQLGLLYQEPELNIDHAHWAFGRTQRQSYHERSQRNWDEDQAVFLKYKAENFSTILAQFPEMTNSKYRSSKG